MCVYIYIYIYVIALFDMLCFSPFSVPPFYFPEGPRRGRGCAP